MFDNLKDKSKEYRPLPFWSWNDKLEPEELRKQIRWFHENGIGGFFMHAREGLQTEYLSKDWMDCVDACCDEAQKLGLEAWGYDENGYPSGFVGGKLLENEENKDMYIRHIFGPFDENAVVSYRIEDDKLVRVYEEQKDAECMNLYFVLSSASVDILNPAVVRQFIDETHEAYKAHYNGAFPEVFKGFFTDEPQYYRYATPYTPMIKEYFAEEYGQDILDELGLLFVEKDGYRTFRYRYWKAMQHLMLEAYAKQIYEWCDENGVALTGHYVEETSMGWQLMCCGGAMPFYEYEHIPGIDWLGKDTSNELSPRQVGSAAAQMGKKKILTETFGCCGWDVSPKELRRIAGFQYATGVNLMCQHLVPYSETGAKKRDHPAHFSPVNPWVKDQFKDFNDYFSRLGYLLGEGKESVNVAMLHPMRSAYFDYKREMEESDFEIATLEKQLQTACRTLSERGISFHFLDETLMEKHGFVEGTKIGCGQCSYDWLVLPDVYTMGTCMEQFLAEYVKNGGKVLLLGQVPAYVEGTPYDYEYLQSNCTLEEIEKAQPFTVENYDTELYCAYRELEGKKYIFVQNGSATNSYTQKFSFSDTTKSFVALDLITLETKELPLTVEVHDEEALLLICSDEVVSEEEEKQEYVLRFENADVDFETNFLTVDRVRYSKDGVNYTEPLLCRQAFLKILEERYEGKLYIEYAFDVECIPEKLTLLAEVKEGDVSTINGHEVHFTKGCEEEPRLLQADISAYVQKGTNVYSTVTNWHEDDFVYRAMFGEGVNHSLMNCIVYDSELEAIYLAGKFGVYSREKYEEHNETVVFGRDFYIGEIPSKVTELTTDGFAFFRGDVTMRQTISLPNADCYLNVDGRYTTAKVKVNGQKAGDIYFDRRIDISKVAKPGDNDVEVTFTVGNRNFLGPFHCDHPETYMSPGIFKMCNLPNAEDGKVRYRLHRFYKK